MEFQDCIKFATENPTCCLATVEGDQPRARFVRLCFADDTGFYFQTESPKAICGQMKNNAKVEVSFVNPEALASPGTHAAGTKMMRVTGRVEFIDDLAIRKRILEDRPFLREYYGIEKPEDPLLVVLRVHSGEAHFWTRQDSMKESEIPRIKF